MPAAAHAEVDVVVVSYNSSATLRECVEALSSVPELHVVVVDNASSDGSLATVSDLPVQAIEAGGNYGFGAGCNRGAAAGGSPYVLFLNPDARIDPRSVQSLVRAVDDARVGAAGPRILSADGELEHSQRRFPSVVSTYAQALFLHRVFPSAAWTDEVVREDALYEIPQSPDWVSGACVLVKRSVLDEINGWDESFFLYSEDTDLCRRIRSAGYDVRFDPAATVVHIGGQSSPRAGLLPVLAKSRVRYATKHFGTAGALLMRSGVAISALTHALVARRNDARKGHVSALRAVLKD